MTAPDRFKSVKVLTNGFYAFYDLHRPVYHAYATAHLPPEEAQIAVGMTFAVVVENWTSVVTERHPARWAWSHHTRTVARRCGHTPTAIEVTRLLHDDLHMTIDQIATVTGTDRAAVLAHLVAADRAVAPHRRRPRPRARPSVSPEERWRNAFRLRTATA
ncbi:hypothetical protein HX747_30590 [Streptomyces sp. L06]|nr:hypothetical protein [Streptomyces sp. L06]